MKKILIATALLAASTTMVFASNFIPLTNVSNSAFETGPSTVQIVNATSCTGNASDTKYTLQSKNAKTMTFYNYYLTKHTSVAPGKTKSVPLNQGTGVAYGPSVFNTTGQALAKPILKKYYLITNWTSVPTVVKTDPCSQAIS
ncbi:hypothetical protein N8865_00880 [Francisellaceae bacterium]|nr:hypothetical protein [Francisellaceae bacterium]